jgi:prepilin-type N-terminal cleavage/methylation domain-containing protein
MLIRRPLLGPLPDQIRLRGHLNRTGFTLLELLLVLGVLVVIASLSWPRMMRYVQENALKQNVETVRRELAATRIHAIESGLTYQFRYEPVGQQFLVLPFERPTEPETGETSPNNQATPPRKAKTVEGRLSADFQFEPPSDSIGQATGGQRLSENWLTLLKNGAQYAQTIWSPPILFRPNGESQDSSLVIKDKSGNTVKVTVRGLTGGVRVEPMQRPQVHP